MRVLESAADPANGKCCPTTRCVANRAVDDVPTEFTANFAVADNPTQTLENFVAENPTQTLDNLAVDEYPLIDRDLAVGENLIENLDFIDNLAVQGNPTQYSGNSNNNTVPGFAIALYVLGALVLVLMLAIAVLLAGLLRKN